MRAPAPAWMSLTGILIALLLLYFVSIPRYKECRRLHPDATALYCWGGR